MNSSSFAVSAGFLCYWNLGQQTDPDILANGLGQLGLPKLAPKPRTWLMSLKAALAEVFGKQEEMIRPLKRKDDNGYTVVVETKGETRNDYAQHVNAKINESGDVIVTDGYADNVELTSKAWHFRRVLPAASVSDLLVSLVAHLGGVTLKDNGGLYFIPESQYATWANVAMVVEAAATNGTANNISIVPLEMNASTLRDIKRSIVHEIETEAQAMKEEIAAGDLSDCVIKRRRAKASSLGDRIRQYEIILGEALTACHENIDTVAQSLAVAVSVEEDKSLFDGIYS